MISYYGFRVDGQSTYNREAVMYSKDEPMNSVIGEERVNLLTMCSTNLEDMIRKLVEGEEKWTKGLTPGRPCLTGRYEHENSPR